MLNNVKSKGFFSTNLLLERYLKDRFIDNDPLQIQHEIQKEIVLSQNFVVELILYDYCGNKL